MFIVFVNNITTLDLTLSETEIQKQTTNWYKLLFKYNETH
jgi:hypothetical protein